jgi:hypothetical protein
LTYHCSLSIGKCVGVHCHSCQAQFTLSCNEQRRDVGRRVADHVQRPVEQTDHGHVLQLQMSTSIFVRSVIIQRMKSHDDGQRVTLDKHTLNVKNNPTRPFLFFIPWSSIDDDDDQLAATNIGDPPACSK